jgi:hypothetical protein
MKTGMHIGHDTDAIKEFRESIMQIIHAPTGDNVKKAALKALTETLSISGMTISDCSIVGDTTHTHHHYPEPEVADTGDDEPDWGIDVSDMTAPEIGG